MGLWDKLRPPVKCSGCNREYAFCVCHVAPAKAVRRQPPGQGKRR